MELIINPTNKCNFNCDFCLASDLPKTNITLTKLEKIIKNYSYNLSMIIINGGDPLMMDPDFYYKLLEFVDKYCQKQIPISFTTNLYDFYINPDKWLDLFKKKYVGIITSFQVDNRRKLNNGEVYSKELYKEILEKFNSLIGYIPNSIAVIDKEKSIETMNETLKVAREVGNMCRLNKAIVEGKEKNYYPRWKYYEDYLEVAKLNPDMIHYELNYINIMNFFKNYTSSCPLSRRCNSQIKCINPDGKIFKCSNIAAAFPNKKEYSATSINDEFSNLYQYIDIDCLSCENFQFCNSCRFEIYEYITNEKTKSEFGKSDYCTHMRQLIPQYKKFFE